MRLSALKESRLECWEMERSVKALIVLLLLSVLFDCQKREVAPGSLESAAL